MNILAVGAHPDDVESRCGGTLAKYAKQGHKVFIATATNGNCGSAVMSMEETARVRKEEARKSAAIIGAEYICLDYDDEMFFEDRNARLKFIDLVRYCKADVILTHSLHDYNPDHELTSKIITDIAVMIPVKHIETKNPPYENIPSIWYFETVCSMGFVPTDYVDISEEFETKMQMLECMTSQRAWMAANFKQMGGDEDKFFRNVRLTSEFRGMQAGCRYAEGFVRALDGYRGMLTQRVLP